MTPSTPPIRFCFGLHLHQPIGNFGYVFEQHVRDVYMPFLERLTTHGFFPVSLHVSGPLIEWLEANDPRYLDALGRLASDGRIELLLAGFYEPVLASLPRADRAQQIDWMRAALRSRFGVTARGLWLTERVWEPDLAADLHDAGVEFVIVDDRHLLVSGFRRAQLHAPVRTEHDGKGIAVFPIDERLRYLIPFQPAPDTAVYLRSLRDQGHRLAVLADDGEKFGGWPGTREWVYDRGWLDSFLNAMQECMGRGEVLLSRFDDALAHVPSGGLAYLATASYREMEGWSLPTEAALQLSALERDLGAQRIAGAEGSLIRGAHWRNFLVKYPEANRMHKKMVALSLLCRERGDPDVARRAIGRAQCNDAYWHGVFGGLYLPFLRSAIWEQLALAEHVLRRDEPIEYEIRDLDFDGHDELWIHSGEFSAIVSPHRGGALEELTRFAAGVNLADTLTRRREAYHVTASEEAARARANPASDASRTGDAAGQPVESASTAAGSSSPATEGDAPALVSTPGAPSIHELEHHLRLEALPPVDLDERALFVERVVAAHVTRSQYERAAYEPLASTARLEMSCNVASGPDRVEVTLRSADSRLEKRLEFFRNGAVRATFLWDVRAFPDTAVFTTEVSCAHELALVCEPPAEVWTHPIETLSKSEKGFDRTRQGVSHLVRWPVRLGRGEVGIAVAEG
jgi:alpha-amylase